MPDPFLSYAQNGEDIVIARVFADLPEPGRFVDVGAADPVVYSATYSLYLRGWRGINIEPVPAFADALRSVRPEDTTVQCAAGDRPGTIDLHVARGTGLSTANADVASRANCLGYETDVITVPIATLDDLLSEHLGPGEDIHVLKIDVEGMEHAVLSGTDLHRWRPWLCVLEATEPLSQVSNYSEWEPLLTSAGYVFHLFDGLNRFYLAPDRQYLADRLASGPCVFDQPYQRAEVSLALERHQDTVQRRLEESRAQISELEARLAELQTDERTARVELDTIRSERDALQLRLQVVEEQHAAQHDALNSAEATVASATARADALAAELETERARSAELSRVVDQALTSVSWRVTRPLRALRARIADPRLTRRGTRSD